MQLCPQREWPQIWTLCFFVDFTRVDGGTFSFWFYVKQMLLGVLVPSQYQRISFGLLTEVSLSLE